MTTSLFPAPANPRPATTEEIFNAVWRACDSFRGVIDPSSYKDYILTFLFLKYLSDLWDERRRFYEEKYATDPERDLRVQRALRHERFQVPDQSRYQYLYECRDQDDIGELINHALDSLEDANRAKLDKVFRGIDFASEAQLGATKDMKRRLKHLIEDFRAIDLTPDHLTSQDVIGDVYEYLIERFASNAGKKAGEFYTPKAVSALLAQLVEPRPGDRICDPTCGSASLLIRTGQQVPNGGSFALYGQELNGATYALARQNCVLHFQDDAVLVQGDTLTNPLLTDGDRLLRFNVVVANPPFSLDKWGHETAAADPYRRFHRGLPPKSKGDFAFISHLVETMTETDGRGGVVVPHGVLFRGAAEGKIRRQLLEEGLIEAVIGLPANLFFGTGIPTAIILLRRQRPTTDVLFVDASRLYTDVRTRAMLMPEHAARIVDVVKGFRQAGAAGPAGVLEPRLAYRATLAELAANDFNLNIPRYVDTFEAEDTVDLPTVQAELHTLEQQLTDVRQRMQQYLKELSGN
ncbi:type I restriction-modification system subunit M [Hymenobacter jeollabukensis]|uniref:site-specific DNA-methyltransferase (adenine-specific) n=1 Tax=Hymenobacter jeollabukensis TaxID=2025313 RepID=A0A5R8WHS7_9BACT|nr:class I SAM-dependent DNA methyltransferase [Hymenobacter jeollabukensis]TLM87857.1 SAM-dependent DNA methyltransferase [Hymenobacter jeollabukensis]